jgi:hypothetical protein
MMLKFDPVYSGPLASEDQLFEFEKQNEIRFSREHRDFMSTQVNGGCPVAQFATPTVDCDGGAGLLDGLYGLNHSDPLYDMQPFSLLTSSLCPIRIR